MPSRGRIRAIEERIGILRQREYARKVRRYIDSRFRREDGLRPKMWPEATVSLVTRIEVFGLDRSLESRCLVNLVKRNDGEAKQILRNYFDGVVVEEDTFICVEVRDTSNRGMVVCSKANWRKVKYEKECLGCDHARMIFDLGKKHGIAKTVLEIARKDFRVQM